MNIITQFIKDIFTAKNGIDYSLTKLLGLFAWGAMFYKFLNSDGVDYVSFATGVAAIMAAMAVKYAVEAK